MKDCNVFLLPCHDNINIDRGGRRGQRPGCKCRKLITSNISLHWIYNTSLYYIFKSSISVDLKHCLIYLIHLIHCLGAQYIYCRTAYFSIRLRHFQRLTFPICGGGYGRESTKSISHKYLRRRAWKREQYNTNTNHFHPGTSRRTNAHSQGIN